MSSSNKVTLFIALTFLVISSPAFSQSWGLGGFTWDKSRNTWVKSDEGKTSDYDSNSNWDSWGSENSRYSTRFPKSYQQGTLVVSFSDRRLYHIVGVGLAVSYPITVPPASYRWSGAYLIHKKAVKPRWTPRKRIFKKYPKHPRGVVGGDPLNPLGARALYFKTDNKSNEDEGFRRIQGTDKPWLIGKAIEDIDIRMVNKDVIHLYNRVHVPTPLIVTWKKFKGVSSQTVQTPKIDNWGWGETPKEKTPKTPNTHSPSTVTLTEETTKKPKLTPRSKKLIALLIGNSQYQNLSSLTNPENDVKVLAKLMRGHGVKVIEYYDLDRAALLDALENFQEMASQYSQALIFYAGHGMEINGRDILAPVDMQYDCTKGKFKRAVPLKELQQVIASIQRKVIILDSCRNKPFIKCKTRGTRRTGGFSGLGRLPHSKGRLLIANATLLGKLTSDGKPGAHSPFAKALIHRLTESPQTYFRDILDQVASDVRKITEGVQIPEIKAQGGAPRICIAKEGCRYGR